MSPLLKDARTLSEAGGENVRAGPFFAFTAFPLLGAFLGAALVGLTFVAGCLVEAAAAAAALATGCTLDLCVLLFFLQHKILIGNLVCS